MREYERIIEKTTKMCAVLIQILSVTNMTRSLLFFANVSLAFASLIIFPVDFETMGTACVTSDGLSGTQKLSDQCESLQEEVYGYLRSVGVVVCCPRTSKAKDFCAKHVKTVENTLDYHIFGGDSAEVAEFPHMVALGYTTFEDVFDCGGSLISEKFVISAAHCFSKKRQYPTFVRLGRVS